MVAGAHVAVLRINSLSIARIVPALLAVEFYVYLLSYAVRMMEQFLLQYYVIDKGVSFYLLNM
jgi:hypothetical protein